MNGRKAKQLEQKVNHRLYKQEALNIPGTLAHVEGAYHRTYQDSKR